MDRVPDDWVMENRQDEPTSTKQYFTARTSLEARITFHDRMDRIKCASAELVGIHHNVQKVISLACLDKYTR